MSTLADYQFTGFVVSEVGLDYQNMADLQSDVRLFKVWRKSYGPKDPVT
jgi:hypothetical protein